MNGNTSKTNPTLSLISNENKTITFASGISSTDNGISLPEMSIKPFIRYYIGVQKRIGERFTGFGLIFFNTLGRGGIGFSFGFKWSLERTLPKKLPEPVYVHE